MIQAIKSLIDQILLTPMRDSDALARENWARSKGGLIDRDVFVVLVTAALSLTFINYLGMTNRLHRVVALFDGIGFDRFACWLEVAMTENGTARRCELAVETLPAGDGHNARFNRLVYWASVSFIGYVVIPGLALKLLLKRTFKEMGMGLSGALKGAHIYGLFFAVMMPLLWLVSYDAHFQNTYPFYDLREGEDLWPYFWLWEIAYFGQFFALEFFFRGFMVHGTKHRLGFASVLVMMVPYCMIHFGKPAPETIGAIIAGIVLGSLSLKSRSIWLGVAIHFSVAITMDLLSLMRKGVLG